MCNTVNVPKTGNSNYGAIRFLNKLMEGFLMVATLFGCHLVLTIKNWTKIQTMSQKPTIQL
jgi:hypothetical protein